MDYRYAGSLLREVAKLYLQSQRDTLACCGPTNASQCTLMTELGRDKTMTVAELARKLDVDKGWVSRVAEGLAGEGLVTKVPGTIDRRTVYIGLTEAGKERYAELTQALDDHAAQLLSLVPAEKHGSVFDVLEMLRSALSGESCCGVKLIQLEEDAAMTDPTRTSPLSPSLTADETRAVVRDRYALTAQNSCCTPTAAQGGAYGGCCGGTVSVDDLGRTLGYSDAELAAVPEGANLGLGCGNPQAIASIQPGETVVDLGSGAGFDAFLAARQVGDQGRVIGVDMTPEMLAKARQNARSAGFANVEFRLGEIEHLPVADQTVDVIISNCVINLSPEKPAVFREAFRVLKPGGRLAVSDMVTSVTLPPDVLADLALYTGCIAGAASLVDLEAMLRDAGFSDIRITPKDSRELLQTWGADAKLEDAIFSAHIQAVRPM